MFLPSYCTAIAGFAYVKPDLSCVVNLLYSRYVAAYVMGLLVSHMGGQTVRSLCHHQFMDRRTGSSVADFRGT